MGVGSSTASGSGMRVPDKTLSALRQICGDEPIPFDSEVWVNAIAQPTPIHTLDQDLVFEAIREVGPLLGKSDRLIQNFVALMALSLCSEECRRHTKPDYPHGPHPSPPSSRCFHGV